MDLIYMNLLLHYSLAPVDNHDIDYLCDDFVQELWVERARKP